MASVCCWDAKSNLDKSPVSFCVCDRGVDSRYPYLARHRCRYSIVASQDTGPGWGSRWERGGGSSSPGTSAPPHTSAWCCGDDQRFAEYHQRMICWDTSSSSEPGSDWFWGTEIVCHSVSAALWSCLCSLHYIHHPSLWLSHHLQTLFDHKLKENIKERIS